jgi:sensor histidine kinase YesM
MNSKPLLLHSTYNALLHIMVWAMLFLLPTLYGNPFKNEEALRFVLLSSWMPLLFCVALFYFNYHFLIERILLIEKRAFRFILTNALVIIVLLFLLEWIKDYVRTDEIRRNIAPMKMWVYIKITFSFIISVVIALSVKMTQKWLQSERDKVGIENQILKSELSMLRFQIQPHFFFNALNNIYSLIDISGEKAKETVHGLGKLMRYLLYETNTEMVSLEKEITFIRNFVSLMRIRLSDNVKVLESYPSHDEVIGLNVAPVLFITLIENAFKHGVSSDKNSEIIISMRLETGKLVFVVQNNNFPKSASDKGGSGVGMENLRMRLQKIYPGSFDLHQQISNNHFTSSLTLIL